MRDDITVKSDLPDGMRGILTMGVAKYVVDLSEAEREQLVKFISRGKVSARKAARARILLKADEGLTDEQVAAALDLGSATVGRIRQRFVEEGLETALNDKARPGQARKLDGKREAHLIAIACSDPPAGHARWSLRLLAGKVVELGLAESICHETVRQVLKKTTSSPGSGACGASRK
jgi:transposase